MGLKFSGKPYEDMLRPNAPHKTNRLGSNIDFHKLRLCISNLESSRKDLVLYS